MSAVPHPHDKTGMPAALAALFGLATLGATAWAASTGQWAWAALPAAGALATAWQGRALLQGVRAQAAALAAGADQAMRISTALASVATPIMLA